MIAATETELSKGPRWVGPCETAVASLSQQAPGHLPNMSQWMELGRVTEVARLHLARDWNNKLADRSDHFGSLQASSSRFLKIGGSHEIGFWPRRVRSVTSQQSQVMLSVGKHDSGGSEVSLLLASCHGSVSSGSLGGSLALFVKSFQEKGSTCQFLVREDVRGGRIRPSQQTLAPSSPQPVDGLFESHEMSWPSRPRRHEKRSRR